MRKTGGLSDREFRRLKRDDLIEIIYQLQLNGIELEKQNNKLKQQLQDRSIKINNAGSIAEASLAINEVFETAQRAADHYLEEINRINLRQKEILSNTRVQADRMIREAKAKCDQMLQDTKRNVATQYCDVPANSGKNLQDKASLIYRRNTETKIGKTEDE